MSNPTRRISHMLACVVLASGSPGLAADAPNAAGAAGEFASRALDSLWPGRPESIDMLADILIKGERIGGGDGWFRKATARTRFTWEATREALDKDGDGAVSRAELGRTDADFAALDRDGNGTLTAPDFDFSSVSSAPPPATAALFGRIDRDGNGKVTRDELDSFFRDSDGEGLGFLSMSELQAAMTPAPPAPGPNSGPPSRWTFLKSFFRRELGAFPPGPSLDEPAPDFTLRAIDDGKAVTLSQLVGPRPVVLVFGNFTCGPFRRQGGNLEKLYQRYKDRATFVMVYVREPHPTDGWRMDANDRVGVAVRQPRDYDERAGVARLCSRTLKLGFPMLVDTMDDAINNLYSGIPSRLYLIDGRGKVAFKNGRGPFGFKLDELEQAIVLLLREADGSARP